MIHTCRTKLNCLDRYLSIKQADMPPFFARFEPNNALQAIMRALGLSIDGLINLTPPFGSFKFLQNLAKDMSASSGEPSAGTHVDAEDLQRVFGNLLQLAEPIDEGPLERPDLLAWLRDNGEPAPRPPPGPLPRRPPSPAGRP